MANVHLMQTPPHPYYHDYPSLKLDTNIATLNFDAPRLAAEAREEAQAAIARAQAEVAAAVVRHTTEGVRDNLLESCSCPAPHHPSAKFCPRCGGTIRKPSAAMAWIRGAAVRPIKMAAAILMTPVFVGATLAYYDGNVEAQWQWWLRMLIPDTLKKICQ